MHCDYLQDSETTHRERRSAITKRDCLSRDIIHDTETNVSGKESDVTESQTNTHSCSSKLLFVYTESVVAHIPHIGGLQRPTAAHGTASRTLQQCSTTDKCQAVVQLEGTVRTTRRSKLAGACSVSRQARRPPSCSRRRSISSRAGAHRPCRNRSDVTAASAS